MMTFLGMWACQHRELQPISFGGIGGGSSKAASSSQQPSEDAQAESSFGRGRGRERSVQEYEMDDMETGDRAV
jgi:hypothetical protein